MNIILVVEDDPVMAEGLKRALSSDDTGIACCTTLQSAQNYIESRIPELMLLDVNLPDGSGFDYLRRLKENYDFPVILLTANDMEMDIVSGLETGADDYITKPFSLAILRARVNTQLRRVKEKRTAGKSRDVISFGIYKFDFKKMEFFADGKRIELSKTEQKLLNIFMENRGITLNRAELVDRVWTDGAEYVDENALSVTVKRLRDKLSAGNYIKTVYGIGYVWVKEPRGNA